jgi:hypothetical protein
MSQKSIARGIPNRTTAQEVGLSSYYIIPYAEGQLNLRFSKKLKTMVRTKSGGNRAVSPEFVIRGVIFHPGWLES